MKTTLQPEEKQIPEFPFTPTGNNIIIYPDTEKDKSPGGIIIPEAAKRPLTQGTVLKCGELVGQSSISKIKISPGDSVIFGLHTDSAIRIDGELFLVVTEDNVLAFQSLKK